MNFRSSLIQALVYPLQPDSDQLVGGRSFPFDRSTLVLPLQEARRELFRLAIRSLLEDSSYPSIRRTPATKPGGTAPPCFNAPLRSDPWQASGKLKRRAVSIPSPPIDH